MLLLKEDFVKFGKVFTSMPNSFSCRLFLDASKSTNARCYDYIKKFLASNEIVSKVGILYHKKYPTIEAFFNYLISQKKQREFFSKYIDMKVITLLFKSAPPIESKRDLLKLCKNKVVSTMFSELRRLQALNLITMSPEGENIKLNFATFEDWMLDFAKRCS